MFTSWLLFHFAITNDDSMVDDYELEAVIACSRYYLSSWLDRGKKNEENLRTVRLRTNWVPPEYTYKPTHLFRTAPSKAAACIPSAFSVIRTCFKLWIYPEITESSVQQLRPITDLLWSYVGTSCCSSPTGGSTIKKRFWVGKNFHPPYIIRIFIFLSSWFILLSGQCQFLQNIFISSAVWWTISVCASHEFLSACCVLFKVLSFLSKFHRLGVGERRVLALL
jgi:hypothetical protein